MSLIFRPASSSLLRSLIRPSSSSSTASGCRDFAPRTTLYQTGRSFFETRRFSSAPSLSTELSDARSRLSSLSVPLDPLTQLSLYALYKQATEGPVSTERPGADPKEVAKWDAWYNLKGLSQEEARDDYLSLVQQLCNQSQKSNGATDLSSSSCDYDGLEVTVQGRVQFITLNRPDRLNSLTKEMYYSIPRALKAAETDPNVKVSVLTGAGRYYSSGNDLANFAIPDPSQLPALAREAREALQIFVQAFIDHPKPLIAAVNGPCMGISFTTLALCDAVYASDRATFNTPFMKIGQSPEGCSSYLFPKIMGQSRANEMLMFDQKITASEAKEAGLITKVVPHVALMDEVRDKAEQISQLPMGSLLKTKALVRNHERELLHKVNREECDLLEERWTSEECMTAVMSFLKRKK